MTNQEIDQNNPESLQDANGVYRVEMGQNPHNPSEDFYVEASFSAEPVSGADLHISLKPEYEVVISVDDGGGLQEYNESAQPVAMIELPDLDTNQLKPAMVVLKSQSGGLFLAELRLDEPETRKRFGRKGAPTLEIIQGSQKSISHLEEGPLRVGRENLLNSNEGISGSHFQIYAEGDRIVVADRSSKNGTRLITKNEVAARTEKNLEDEEKAKYEESKRLTKEGHNRLEELGQRIVDPDNIIRLNSKGFLTVGNKLALVDEQGLATTISTTLRIRRQQKPDDLLKLNRSVGGLLEWPNKPDDLPADPEFFGVKTLEERNRVESTIERFAQYLANKELEHLYREGEDGSEENNQQPDDERMQQLSRRYFEEGGADKMPSELNAFIVNRCNELIFDGWREFKQQKNRQRHQELLAVEAERKANRPPTTEEQIADLESALQVLNQQYHELRSKYDEDVFIELWEYGARTANSHDPEYQHDGGSNERRLANDALSELQKAGVDPEDREFARDYILRRNSLHKQIEHLKN